MVSAFSYRRQVISPRPLAGDISSVTVFGQTLVILNSAQAATDILDKKSATYSDRPVLQMGGELVGWKNTLVLLPYGDRFRRFRKIFHSLIGTQSMMKQYHPAEELETRRFLKRVLSKPEALSDHVRKYVPFIFASPPIHVLPIGLLAPSSFAFLTGTKSRRTMTPSSDSQTKPRSSSRLPQLPGHTWLTSSLFVCFSFPVSGLVALILYPLVRHLPDWCPGAAFKRSARKWAATLSEMVDQPHNFVKQQIVGYR